MYINMESTLPKQFRGDFCSVYRLHDTQKNLLEPMVSAKKLVLENIERVPRYQPKYLQIWVARSNLFSFSDILALSPDLVHTFTKVRVRVVWG